MNIQIVSYEDYESLSKKVIALEQKISKITSVSLEEKKKEYFTVKEFLEETGISRTTFEKMRREEDQHKFRLEVIKRGGKVYIHHKEKDRYFTFK